MQRTGTQVAIEPWFAHCCYHSIGGAEASVVMSTASSDTVGGQMRPACDSDPVLHLALFYCAGR